MRSLYTVYDFGDYDSSGKMGNPYMQLLALVDPNTASKEFHSARGGSAFSNLSYTPQAISGTSAASSGSDTTTTSDLVSTVNQLSKYIPAMLAVMALNALVILVLAAAAIAVGVVPVLAITLASGAVPFTGIAVVPVAGIVIGGAMTATSLGGRRALDDLESRRDEYEGALALGGRHRDAAMIVCRPAATQALVPPLDQTRTVGLVTLPGAFVGVLLGGGTPLEAGAAQLLVLVGLLAAEVLAVWAVTELVGRGALLDDVPR